MKFICSKEALLNSINISMRAISNKTTMEILSCIYIDATKDKIKFISNDLEICIETIVEGEILEPGEYAVDARIFSEMIKKLPDRDENNESAKVIFDSSFGDNTALITCQKVKFKISGRNIDEFPDLPSVLKDYPIEISQLNLREAIRKTIFSVSKNEKADKKLTGELFEVNGNMLTVAALDGHRIAVRKIELANNYDHKKIIIPFKALDELSKTLNGGIDDIVSIFIANKHCLFEFENTTIISRLIEGEYYSVEKMFMSEYFARIKVNRQDLIDCIERSLIYTRDAEVNSIEFTISEDNLKIYAYNDVSSLSDEVAIVKEGNDIVVCYNPRFMLDILKVLEEDEVVIDVCGTSAPCIIKNDDYSYLFLPMRRSNK